MTDITQSQGFNFAYVRNVEKYLGYTTPARQSPSGLWGDSAIAAQNDAMFAAAATSGYPLLLPRQNNPYLISAPIDVPQGFTIDGGSRSRTNIRQTASNTPIMRPHGSDANILNLRLSYASRRGAPGVTGEESSIGIEYGGSEFWYNSTMYNVAVQNARHSMRRRQDNGGYGEFANVYDRFQLLYQTGLAWELWSGSGSQIGQGRIEGTGTGFGAGSIPANPDMEQAMQIYGNEAINISRIDIEHMYCSSGRVINLENQSNVNFNALHFEGLGGSTTDNSMTWLRAGYQGNITIGLLNVTYCGINGHTNLASLPAGQLSSLDIGLLETHDNVYATGKKLLLANAGDNNCSVRVRRISGRREANLILPSRNSVKEIGALRLDDNGKLAGGYSIATGSAPTTGMPYPFTDTSGNPLPWQVGDDAPLIAATAAPFNARCTAAGTSGSPAGTWTAY